MFLKSNDLISFLSNKSPDHAGRKLSDILLFSDGDIENTHDFIQWIFPLSEPSGSVYGVPFLNEETIIQIKNDREVLDNILEANGWFLDFLSRSKSWRSEYNHNHLRITRILKCLVILGLKNEAQRSYSKILAILGNDVCRIDYTALQYWKNAIDN